MIKFGQSTRDWLLCGPAELMPEEGPSKTQRLEARLLKVPPARCSSTWLLLSTFQLSFATCSTLRMHVLWQPHSLKGRA